jgi:hypothetical protein
VSVAAGWSGNRTALTDYGVVQASYCYDGADRLTATTQAGYVGPIVYDAHGNTSALAGASYSYDIANRHMGTVSATVANATTTVTYQRDLSDVIVARAVSTSTVATISPRSAATTAVGSSNATSLTVARPAGVVVGDVLLATVTINSNATVTAPAGWVLVATVASGTAQRASTFRKLAGAGEPVSYAFVWSGNAKAAGWMIAYTGVDPVNPVDVSATYANPASSAQSAPSVTTTGAGRTVVRVWANKALTAIVPPAGLSVLAQATGTTSQGVSLAAAAAVQPAGGVSGVSVATAGSAVGVNTTIALRQAVTTVTETQRYSVGQLESDRGTYCRCARWRAGHRPGGWERVVVSEHSW